MKFKVFLGKCKKFIKRNIYAIGVASCALIALVAITLVAVFASTPDVPVIDNTPVETVTPSAVVFINPIEGADITKEFAHDKLLEDKTSGYWQTHSGVDIKASQGTSVVAVFDGTIESVESTMMEGTVIKIKHSNSLSTVYKCLSDNNVSVKAGDKVKKGDKIGEVGESLKEKADGAHLHFEVIEDGKQINPLTYLENNEDK